VIVGSATITLFFVEALGNEVQLRSRSAADRPQSDPEARFICMARQCAGALLTIALIWAVYCMAIWTDFH